MNPIHMPIHAQIKLRITEESFMEKSIKILRRSVVAFLQFYHPLATCVACLILPVSAAILLSQPIPSSAVFRSFYSHLELVFRAAGLQSASPLLSLLNLKLSQTLASGLLSLPFTLSFLLIAKSAIICLLSSRPISLVFHLYYKLLITQILNSLLILSANSGALALMFLTFNFSEILGLSSSKYFLVLSACAAVLYSILVANALVVCNLAQIQAGMEGCVGHVAVLRACVLISGKTTTALLLALPTHLALAAVEALFQYRVMRGYFLLGRRDAYAFCETLLIMYMYSLVVVLDTIVGCIFYNSCKAESMPTKQYVYYYPMKIEGSGVSRSVNVLQ